MAQHVVLVAFPLYGHINPTMELAKRLMRIGVEVTFVTSVATRRRVEKFVSASQKYGFSCFAAYFSDGFDDGYKLTDDLTKLLDGLKSAGAATLRDVIVAAAELNRPVSYMVATPFLPWAADVARGFNIPAALLWTQPAAVLGTYYHYFNGFADEVSRKYDDPKWKLQLPGYPYAVASRDLPTFLLPSCDEATVTQVYKEQIEYLDNKTVSKILVNTFDALEHGLLEAGFGKYEMIGIGPLVSDAFLKKNTEEVDDECLRWLNTKPNSSVVFVCFGSLVALPKPQMEEIAKGLLKSKRPFLWVIREEESSKAMKKLIGEVEESFGKIIPWCSQLHVLSHPALGCFVTHCGWNSTLESLCCGVPTVAFPSWGEQGMNAMMIAEAWKTGVRVRANDEVGGELTVDSEEIFRCIEQVMDGGEAGRELRHNVHKWKVLAREAMAEVHGTSYTNLRELFAAHGTQ